MFKDLRKRFAVVLALTLGFALCASPALAAWGPNQDHKIFAQDLSNDVGFGYSVSLSGDMAIVGCLETGTATRPGQAYIFERVGGVWTQKAKLLPGTGSVDDQFGTSVSLSGDTAIVGAKGDDDNGESSGAAYVFSQNQGGPDNWGQVAKLLPVDGATNDRFGCSVSLSGDTAMVGSRYDDNSGSAYVFAKGGAWADGSGNQVAKLLPVDGAALDSFGCSVSLSGDTAMVGSQYDDNSGSAYIFQKGAAWADGSGNQVAKVWANDGASFDWFGESVSLSGDTAIVGAYGNDEIGNSAGAAYVFSKDQGGAGNWGQVKKLLPGDGAAFDKFGNSVSLSGDTAIVGAHNNSDLGLRSGSAYVFSKDQGGADNWGQAEKLLPDDGAVADYFGRSVSISGDTAIVGAWGHRTMGWWNAGAAYLFDNFVDLCPGNPDKTEPGICGCDQPDTGDSDHDGILDCLDNCMLVANANQKDWNGDGNGDACMPRGDTDGDGDVDPADYAWLQGLIPAALGDPGYESASDLNQDGRITSGDALMWMREFGRPTVPRRGGGRPRR